MILHINAKLNVWADWVASDRKVRGLGYPSQCAFMRMTPNGGTLIAPMLDEESIEVDHAVCALEQKLREVVEQFYRHAGTAEDHAKALHICKDTLYVRLHAAHVRIMEWLQVGDDDADDKKFLTASDAFTINAVR